MTELPAVNRSEVVALEDVSVVREGRWILQDVNWKVRRHQRWVVLGPNGAGKTTLLQVASTYLGPTRGTVRLLGEMYGKVDVRQLRQRVGYAGPAPAEMVRDYMPAIDVVATGKHASFVDKRFHDYEAEDWSVARRQLERLVAGHLADRRFGTLSTGEKQRVLIARSLMTDPELLLLDEAMTGLDLGARERLVASLADLAADPDSPAVVLVTHHVEEIPPGFGHIAMISRGTLSAVGPIEVVLSAEALSDCFEQELCLEKQDRRYHAWSRNS